MTKDTWNWQQEDWPDFSYDKHGLEPLEREFASGSGLSLGLGRHLSAIDKDELIVELVCREALNSSEIEGEYLNRESLQSSIRREFGLGGADTISPGPAEAGIAEVMRHLYTNYNSALTKEDLCHWNMLLLAGRRRVKRGTYRTHEDPMQVVSGRYDKPTVHFEAPPSSAVPFEMKRFLHWFNETAPGAKMALPPLVRAGIAHLYFVSIHPFEDGNGRIARGIVEKALSQSMGRPSLVALSWMINEKRKEYYDQLAAQCRSNHIDGWLNYFARTVIEAQKKSIEHVEFLAAKAKFLDVHREKLNPRQLKVVLRLFAAGPEGFTGGLSAKNYQAIAKTSPATATRDLNDLVAHSVLLKWGQLKGTRYRLNLDVG